MLGPDLGAEAAEWYGVTEEGNFEGRTVLHRSRRGELLRPPRIETARAELLAARAGRVRPGLDDKIITEWNAMMCSTLAEAAAATGRDDWSEAAVEIATFLLGRLRRPDGRVLRSWCRGRVGALGYGADYAWLVDCCTRLGELSGDPRWTAQAVTIAHQLLELFSDDDHGGLYTTGSDAAPLLVRPREAQDGVTPSAGSVAAIALARLGALAGDDELSTAAERIVGSATPLAVAAPWAFAELLLGAALVEHGPAEIVVTGDRADLVHAARMRFVPESVLAWRSPAIAVGAGNGGLLLRAPFSPAVRRASHISAAGARASLRSTMSIPSFRPSTQWLRRETARGEAARRTGAADRAPSGRTDRATCSDASFSHGVPNGWRSTSPPVPWCAAGHPAGRWWPRTRALSPGRRPTARRADFIQVRSWTWSRSSS